MSLTQTEAMALLERKLARRRWLNQDEVRARRRSFAPPTRSIALTFSEAEAVLTLLDKDDAPRRED